MIDKEYSRRPTIARINLANLTYNFRSVQSFVGAETKILAVVKADAYGHGAVECARLLEREGAEFFGVAIPEEALELREAGITLPILSLGGFWHGQENLLLDKRVTPVIFGRESADSLNRVAGARGVVADVHVKVDTGMGRLGVPFADVAGFAGFLRELKNIRVTGLMTHFAAADDLGETEFTDLQIKLFGDALAIFRSAGHNCQIHDLANSPGAVCHPKSRGMMVRIGGILYGLGDDVLPALAPKPDLKPVMSVVSQVSLLKTVPVNTTLGYARSFRTSRNSLIASVPVGYNDGVPRSLSNRGEVLIRGHRAPIVGRVSMDWILADVTGIDNVRLGDEVVFIGTSGTETVAAADIARLTGTISYEITCGIGGRVPRIFFDADGAVML